jgi:Xaa-Pro aminopeptidase
MKQHAIDYYIVPSVDEFQGEYVPPHNARLEFITGFTGSNGVALIGQHENRFLTDGRYMLQAPMQLGKEFIVRDFAKCRLSAMLQELVDQGKTVGVDPKLLSVAQVKALGDLASSLCFIDQNLIDAVWTNRPKRRKSKIFLYDTKYAGQSADAKLKQVSTTLKEKSIDAVVLTDPHSVCWLLNIRGHDLGYTPIVLCYAILSSDGRVKLFLYDQPGKSILKYLASNSVEICVMNDFIQELGKIRGRVGINNRTPYNVLCGTAHSVLDEDPCLMPKSCKTATELRWAVQAHVKDGKAMTRFLKWLKQSVGKRKLTEVSIGKKLLECRKKQTGFVCESFAPIVGFKEHGAIVHYQATKATDKEIKGSGLLLIDSGGQYLGGTTDITRTVAIGNPTEEEIHDFTLVLKGHLRVAMATFKEGTTGVELDKLARSALQAEGKDYAHGTGHGVGNFLSVHEGPQSISWVGNVALKPGMIVSIEPGYYKAGCYGIRIESLAYVQKLEDGMLGFRVMTTVPLDERLIDRGQLTQEELDWLEYNSYLK